MKSIPSEKSRTTETLAMVFGLCSWAIFVAMFFASKDSALDTFVMWTLRIYLGALAASIIGVVVVGPGVLITKELFDLVSERGVSTLEYCLTWAWAGFAGLLLTAVLASAAWMMTFAL
jgi:hypothetical protein